MLIEGQGHPHAVKSICHCNYHKACCWILTFKRSETVFMFQNLVLKKNLFTVAKCIYE